ncbi:MAG: hypothetical protein K0S08_1056 [Gammaproteobacteria bacterium]|nr:hypothetical protein [Gammaproteobacteria bacterium]
MKSLQKYISTFFLTFLFALGLVACATKNSKPHYTWVTIDGTMVYAQLSVTDQEHIKGLQFVTGLGPNEGMLFVYNPPRILTHWMKDMRIPLDMIWISSDKKILSISKNALVCQNDPCPIYSSQVPAAYVLEVNAGFCTLHHIDPGMVVNFHE